MENTNQTMLATHLPYLHYSSQCSQGIHLGKLQIAFIRLLQEKPISLSAEMGSDSERTVLALFGLDASPDCGEFASGTNRS